MASMATSTSRVRSKVSTYKSSMRCKTFMSRAWSPDPPMCSWNDRPRQVVPDSQAPQPRPNQSPTTRATAIPTVASSSFRKSNDLDPRLVQKLQTTWVLVGARIHHPHDARLVDELGALAARRQRDVQRGALGTVAALGQLGDRVGLGMKHVPMGFSFVVFADVGEAARGAVVAVGDDHLVFDNQRADLLARNGTVGPIRGPSACRLGRIAVASRP